MFTPRTGRIKELASEEPQTIEFLKSVFSGKVNMYIDFANVRPWSQKLKWHIDLKRLKQFLNSFDNIASVKLYNGTLKGDLQSEDHIKKARKLGYEVRTKPVKIMRLSVDASSVSRQSPDLLKNFIRGSLLLKLSIETVEQLNNAFADMNVQGIYHLEDRKCNFDVEIGRDMLRDFDKDNVGTFVLWSGDSDFAEPISELLEAGKKVVLFATSRRVSRELDALQTRGLFIFDIQKIRNFVCYKKEMQKGPKKGP